ncbi:hypothetical protein SAMN05421830_10921 [Desulfomicrobium norvegicum]|uniref:Uncharacterized protein n=1 Tax=Desulfomicrobium norvegicum (strain DSM 1741 / NCIMB 8310) TaxID=52561 RepID=A0A8G2C431_DESNO|nr:hypothetical protein SAMN05421830_10921 [Desulfomicrobium norvegicum]
MPFGIVSIHAPARGATDKRVLSRQTVYVSIHAPARGATLENADESAIYLFQSTPLREGRQNPVDYRGKLRGFNPRPCERGDVDKLKANLAAPKFQSTPLREGRPLFTTRRNSQLAFQSTPLREGRPGRLDSADSAGLFQSTPLREGRPSQPNRPLRLTWFQSTPLREGRHAHSSCRRAGRGFNPRPCERGDARATRFSPMSSVSIHAPARGATTCDWLKSVLA